MMHMTFYWSREVTLLFTSWKTTSWLAYALTLVACFAASAFYQYIEYTRLRLKQNAKNPSQSADLEEPLILAQKSTLAGKWSAKKIATGILFGFSSGFGYLLMLAVMSFNGGVFVAIVLGLTAGYLVFRTAEEDEATAAEDSPCACS